MSKIDELIEALQDNERVAPPGTVWAKVSSIDWEAKTMVAERLVDGLAYYDVLLGLGAFYRKPLKGSLALLGILEGDEANAYLIEAQEIEGYYIEDKTGFKWSLNEGLQTINGENYGGIVIAPELKTQIDKNTLILKKIQEALNTWVPSPNDGGAALKTKVAAIPSMQRADLKDIQNTTIKHGNG